RRSTSATFDTSPCTPVTLRPISVTAAANSAPPRPVMKTDAPSWTNCFAVARPMPLLPPVTSATFPSSLPIYSSLMCGSSVRSHQRFDGEHRTPERTSVDPIRVQLEHLVIQFTRGRCLHGQALEIA